MIALSLDASDWHLNLYLLELLALLMLNSSQATMRHKNRPKNYLYLQDHQITKKKKKKTKSWLYELYQTYLVAISH